VFGGDAAGVFQIGLPGLDEAGREALLPFDMLVAPIVKGEAQPVGIGQVDVELGGAAIRLVGIIAVEGAALGLGGLAGVVERTQQVVEAVAVETGLERRPVAERGGREEIEAFYVPVGPGPVALAVRVVGHVER